jgi:CHAT domain-containing protein
VVPDDMIQFISFDILVPDLEKMEYLIEDHEVNYAYSYFQLFEDGEQNNLERILILTPDYSNDNNLIAASRGELYQLVHTKEESEIIMAQVKKKDSKVLSQFSGSWTENIRHYKNFHYAGHAVVEGKNSYLALSIDEDDRLYADDIARQQLSLDLVALSACETGIGEVIYGEGLKSIGRSFSMAGAQNIIQSLWLVNDQSTSSIMAEFYNQLTRGKTVSSSLRNAKLHFVKNARPEHRHPYYWAGFVGVGTHNNSNYWGYILPIFSLLAFVILVIIFKKTKS